MVVPMSQVCDECIGYVSNKCWISLGHILLCWDRALVSLRLCTFNIYARMQCLHAAVLRSVAAAGSPSRIRE